MMPTSLLLLTAHAIAVPIDMDEAVVSVDPGFNIDVVAAPTAAPRSGLSALLQGQEKIELGRGPEVPLPLYYSDEHKILAIGPEGQFEHLSDDTLSTGQKTMMKSFANKFFDGSDHIPMKEILGMCATMFGKHDKVENCVGMLSKMTPKHMAGMRKLMMAAPSAQFPDGQEDDPDNLKSLHMLDRGKVLLPGSQLDTTADLTDPSAACATMDPEMRSACTEVMTESVKTQSGPAKECPRMEIDNQGFTTSHYAYSLDKLTPFFTLQKNFHYFDAEKELRTKYETRPTELGCGVVAKAGYERGDLIGLAGIAHATFYQGLMVALQETPWIGTNMNHCPEADAIDITEATTQNHANAVIKLVEEEHKPTALWVYASEPIAAGEEITMDYNRASDKYPNFIAPANKGWKCMKAENAATGEKALRTEAAR
jgi:hypothetical protein